MRFPFRDALPEGALRNFEFLEQSGLYWGVGAPAFVPTSNLSAQKQAAFYFNLDPTATATHWIYRWSGSAWTGIV